MEKENVKLRRVKTFVKDEEIEYDEYYLVDPITLEEVFDRNIEIENDIRLYDIYKKRHNLLTSEEIKEIRKKYGMNQKEYALSIGLGEISVHRFENGSIQTEAIDAIMRLSSNPDNMYDLIRNNRKNLLQEKYDLFVENINLRRNLKYHNIATLDVEKLKSLKFETANTLDLADYLISKYNGKIDEMKEKYNIKDMSNKAEYITPLKLQKLLYYIQALSLVVYDKEAFKSKIYAWSYGPVVEDVYKKYKGKTPIITSNKIVNLSEGLKEIVDIVIQSYGQIEAKKLIDLTHDEEPWKGNEKNNIIDVTKIKDYFSEVYKV